MEKLDYINVGAIIEEAETVNTQLILGTLTEGQLVMKVQEELENGDDYKVAVYSLAMANYFAREQALKMRRS